MTTTMQPWLLDTGTAILEVAVARPLPVNRVQVSYHREPSGCGYQVQVVRGEQVETLPTVYEHAWDAEERAAVVAVKSDVTLWLDDDPGGEMAECLMDCVILEDERWEQVYGWQR